MRQSEVENMLKDLDLRLRKSEGKYFIGVDLAKGKDKTEVKSLSKEQIEKLEKDSSFKDALQENNKQSVDEKERITKNEGPKPSIEDVSTTESQVGESPVEIKLKKK